jgi:hypothetical protein
MNANANANVLELTSVDYKRLDYSIVQLTVDSIPAENIKIKLRQITKSQKKKYTKNNYSTITFLIFLYNVQYNTIQ